MEDLFPIKNGDISASYVSLPEGIYTFKKNPEFTNMTAWKVHHFRLGESPRLIHCAFSCYFSGGLIIHAQYGIRYMY